MRTALDERPNAVEVMREGFAQPTGGEMVPYTAPAHSSRNAPAIITARHVEVKRDLAKIMRDIGVMAKAAGGEWYYRYPVSDKGGKKFIEGPSIKCANNVARMYGNCLVDTDVHDAGDSWIIHARFVDLETGFGYSRPFQQRKGQQTLNTKDPGRALDIALQIGVSKAIRNVITNALDTFTNFAFEEAQKNVIETIGKNLEAYRDRVIKRLGEMGVATARVEAMAGRVAKDWLATDVARIIAEVQAINDGMATIDDTWPPLAGDAAPPKPTRQDAKKAAPKGDIYEVVDMVGEIAKHEGSDAAASAFRLAMGAAALQGEAALTTMLDNNAGLIDQLEKHGLGALAKELLGEHEAALQAIRAPAHTSGESAPEDTTQPASQDATPAERLDASGATSLSGDAPGQTRRGEPSEEGAQGSPPEGGTPALSQATAKPEPAPGAPAPAAADAPQRSDLWNAASYMIELPMKQDRSVNFQMLRDQLMRLVTQAETQDELGKFEADNTPHLERLDAAFPNYGTVIRAALKKKRDEIK